MSPALKQYRFWPNVFIKSYIYVMICEKVIFESLEEAGFGGRGNVTSSLEMSSGAIWCLR